MDEGASDDDRTTFRQKIAGLKPQELRDTFKAEATSHRGMLQREEPYALKVDPRWKKFANFLHDMGPIPHDGWTIDRIDSQRREYGPGLCRWASPKTQSENRVTTRWVEVNGTRMTAADLIRLSGRPASSVYAALDAGHSPDAILNRNHDNDYRPLSHEDERTFEAWKAAYRKWLKTFVHPAKHPYAPAPVYDLVRTSIDAVHADKELTARGYYEMTPAEEAERAVLVASPAGQMRTVIAPARAAHALSALRASDPRLAARLTKPNGGYHLLTFYQWALLLEKPPL